MASLRRIDQQVRSAGVAAVDATAASVHSNLVKDWSLHAARADLDRRSIALQHQKAGMWLPGERAAAAAETAASRLSEERVQNVAAQKLCEDLSRQIQANQRQEVQREVALQRASSSPNLRGLQLQHLDAAAREQRDIQLLQKRLQSEQGRQEELASREACQAQTLYDQQTQLLRRSAKREQGKHLRQELLDQVAAVRAARGAAATEERLQDRRRADEAAARVCQEDQMALVRKHSLQSEVRAALDRLLVHQRVVQISSLEMQAVQRQQADRHCQVARSLELRFAAERAAAELHREKRLEALVRDLDQRAVASRAGLDSLRQALDIEQYEVTQRRKDEEMLRARLQARAIAANDCNEALQRLAERKQLEEMELRVWRDSFLQHAAEAEQLEQLSDQRRRMRLAAHRRDVEQLAEERRLRSCAQLASEQQRLCHQQAEEEFHLAVIEQERQQLLLELELARGPLCIASQLFLPKMRSGRLIWHAADSPPQAAIIV